ncbi:glutathione S-transferase N-terminal domain-containing protein [Bradyrhizobium sp. USDA 3256]
MSQPTPILHHFDQSPFSEKIRIIFGFKKLAWNSVRISRIMPRPDLMPMTGGYRRTPTMQIGADIYCDTQIIIRELERRYPTPTLFPAGNAGMPWARHVDRPAVLPEHGQPRVRLHRRQGPAGFHRGSREVARRQVRRRRHDRGAAADARPVPRQYRLDRGATRRRPAVAVRRVQPSRTSAPT